MRRSTRHLEVRRDVDGLQHRTPATRDPDRYGLDEWIAVALTVFMVLGFSWIHWTRLPGMWGDSTRWLFEASRMASGELPYRDFTWQYPPLGLMVVGSSFSIFGATFLTAQIVVSLLSAVVVVLTWRVARVLLPPLLALGSTALLVAGGGQIGLLFSLEVYSPALLTGFIGLLLALLGGMRIVAGALDWRPRAILVVGCFIALLSKVEFALAAGVVVVSTSLLDARGRVGRDGWGGWLASWLPLGLACLLPALVAYALLARVVGTRELLVALSGYGIAADACPYWPTGIGVVSVIGALGLGLFLAAVLSLLGAPSLVRGQPRGYGLLWLGALAGLGAYALYLRLFLDTMAATDLGFGSSAHAPPPFAFRAISATVTFSGPGLAVQYWAIVLLPLTVLALRVKDETAPSRDWADPALIVLLGATAALAFRSLFGTTLWDVPSLEKATYPFLAVLATVLAWKVIAWASARSRAGGFGKPEGAYGRRVRRLAAGAIMAWALVLFLGRAIRDASAHTYRTLQTEAGVIRLLAFDDAEAIYRLVIESAAPGDAVADVPYGGGINFATRRPSPLYSTQQKMLRAPEWIRDRDLDRVVASPPAVVVAEAAPDLGAVYGLGRWSSCPMPELVWRPSRLADEKRTLFPMIEFLEREYEPVARVGHRVVMRPRSIPVDGTAGLTPPAVPLARVDSTRSGDYH